MDMRLVRWVIAGLILSGFVFVLSGCASGILHETESRHLEAKLSIGDTRQQVRSVLGEPLLDARSLGLEVYRKPGRDIDYFMPFVPIPFPAPGMKVIGYMLVDYDEHDVVSEFAADYWIQYDHGQHGDLWITAGGYHFINVWNQEPVTLLGAAIPWDKLSEQPPPAGTCTLFLVMGECVMEKVILDHQKIADLSPAGEFCSHYANNNFYGTFLRKNIASGSHSLNINQVEIRRKFDTVFECESGDTVYAQLASADAYEEHPDSISISNIPSKRIMKMGHLSPILWHRGVWYVGSDKAP
jgi:hypothetical protein